jgi:hypothetical protein
MPSRILTKSRHKTFEKNMSKFHFSKISLYFNYWLGREVWGRGERGEEGDKAQMHMCAFSV